MNEGAKNALSKVPEVTLGFWITKILATTIGETGGDAVTMSLFHADKDANNGGYLIGTCLFLALFIAAVIIQMTMKRFHPLIYWLTIVATTTVGTAMADFADRSLGIGYLGGSSLLFALLMMSLLLWRWSEGTVSVKLGCNAAGGSLLLDHDPLLADLGHRARGLDGRHEQPRLRERRHRVRSRSLTPCFGLLLHWRVARLSVLGGVHPHPTAGRDARRPVRQADLPGRVRGQPHGRDCNPRSGDRRANSYSPTPCGQPSRFPFGDARRMTSGFSGTNGAGHDGHKLDACRPNSVSGIFSLPRRVCGSAYRCPCS
jgi:Repeat of Unknown Function (DUF347)